MANRLITPRNSLILPNGYRKPAQPFLDRTHPINRGIVGAWMLGDAETGSAMFAQDLTGVSVGTPTTVSRVGSHHGGEAYAYVNNANGHQLAYNPAWNFVSNEPITISAWGNLTFGQGGNIISNTQQSGSNANWCLYYNSSSSISFFYGSSGYQIFGQTGSQVLYSGWHHLAFTYIYTNATSAQLYVDGQPVAGSWNTGAGTGSPTSATIGQIAGNNGGVNVLGGSLEGIRVYKRYLSAAEIARLYAEPYAGIYNEHQYIIGGTAAVSPNVNLTAVSAAGSAQAITPEVDATLTAVTATGSAQSVTPSVAVTLGAVSAAGAANAVTVTGTANINLTAVSATGSAQATTPEVDKPLTAASASGAANSITTSTSVSTTLSAASAVGAATAVSISLGKNVNLVAVSASGQVNPFTFTITSSVNLVGVSAAGIARNVSFPIDAVTFPVFSLMRSDPVASFGAMGVDS